MSSRVQARDITVHDRLNAVSVTVATGEIHALVGPNGSGKSTLLAVLAGDLTPDAGSVLIDGTEWSRISAREAARRRALLAQETPLAFPFTVREVVGWGRLPWRGTDAAVDDDRRRPARLLVRRLTEPALFRGSETLAQPLGHAHGSPRRRIHDGEARRRLRSHFAILIEDAIDDGVRRACHIGDARLDHDGLAGVAQRLHVPDFLRDDDLDVVVVDDGIEFADESHPGFLQVVVIRDVVDVAQWIEVTETPLDLHAGHDAPPTEIVLLFTPFADA